MGSAPASAPDLARRWADALLAISGGVLLALMINYNSLLAEYTTPTFASWVAHGLGAVAALLLVLLSQRLSRRSGRRAGETAAGTRRSRTGAPLWFYLGGIPGAFTVILAAVAVNGGLALSGTIAFMLAGQVLFGIVSDNFGFFGTPRRRFVTIDVVVALSILTGSALILFGGA